jgi:HSP20 family molecular chaperone IbpA
MNDFLNNYLSVFPPISGMYEDFLNQLNSSIFSKPMLKKVFPYPVNIYNIIDKDNKTNKSTIVEIALAGFTKKEISVKAIPGKSLTIEINPIVEDSEISKNKKFLMNGISKRKASITWSLSNKVDFSNFKPKFSNGILTIELPLITEIKEDEIVGIIED